MPAKRRWQAFFMQFRVSCCQDPRGFVNHRPKLGYGMPINHVWVCSVDGS